MYLAIHYSLPSYDYIRIRTVNRTYSSLVWIRKYCCLGLLAARADREQKTSQEEEENEGKEENKT